MAAGRCAIAFECSGPKTFLTRTYAASPVRLLAPRNHGRFAWVFLANLGGGLVDGDRLDVEVDVGEGAAALLGTQASTKVYRSPRGCSQRLSARVARDGVLAVLPDPVVCFEAARYVQDVEVTLAETASLILVDGYTCGRSARGERWRFRRYESRTRVVRSDGATLVDATRLEPDHGALAERMGHFDVVLTLLAIGPRTGAVREAMLAHEAAAERGGRGEGGGGVESVLVAPSPIGVDGAVLRVAATRLQAAARSIRSSLAAIADLLGDDPFARKG